ncbi:MAG: TlyA family rRNA (cytidine-2'-O)-methyltransferase [Candidatus Margulisiibacteriota bacterium]|nr:MAG: hypothetical protein A2X43_10025 [Candidatus Margulisbacteria bacterium GWD2_39_127]OGI03097.1 MAG: hypothetical protein A2X42_00480 [Candidatus Margulisbacteria bacterium GWF2_38_17]OGI07689.1 MAG: hypothetical protein A2X41_04635 [Candidatus Margulisbacteria bacterium GWE2_39_32]PZM79642.1 MAG: TlyA family rRNA (cytidine-2'-O)-methyltransferase [Candidatus Margulisiibacteriota bacterium]HAR61890.1 TlyA family rRNA (cytidine-2'-O)-methyltransferase [Candidatus Margulisiibacteriota bact
MNKKVRIDHLLVEKELFPTKHKAQAAIMSGKIFVDNKRIDKCGTFVKPSSPIEITKPELTYVGRGGEKLEKAILTFNIDVSRKSAADIGASTGGFSDCLLHNGCALVYAIDVGYGQLDMAIRKDHRVIPIERTNARHLTWETFREISLKAIKSEIKQGKNLEITEPEPVDLIVMDVSFISILKILEALKNIMKPEADIVSLVKPQFEATKEQVGKGGVITDPKVHGEVLERVINGAKEQGFETINWCESPIKGATGNKEFFVHLRLNQS